MITNVIIGSCTALEGFIWSIAAIDKEQNLVQLSYPIVVSDEYLPKVEEKIEKQKSLWKLSDIKNKASEVKCPKDYK